MAIPPEKSGTEIIPLIFDGQEIRKVLDEGQWKYCIADCIRALTGSKDPAGYWRVLKKRLKAEGAFQPVTNCNGFKNQPVTNGDGFKFKRFKTAAADGKMRLMEYGTMEEIFRIIESVPSPKAEPFKIAIAGNAAQKVKEALNPDLAIRSGVEGYMRKGLSPRQAEARMRSVFTRTALTQAWKEHGIEGDGYAKLTDLETRKTFGKSTAQLKRERGVIHGTAKDGMTLKELSAQAVSDAAIALLVEKHDPYGYEENAVEVVKGSAAGREVLAVMNRILEE